jgi:hypothetical protein
MTAVAGQGLIASVVGLLGLASLHLRLEERPCQLACDPLTGDVDGDEFHVLAVCLDGQPGRR